MSEHKPSVLVTGGAKRLGAAMSRAFDKAGWHVVIHYNSSGTEADELAASLDSAETVGCDLSDGNAAVAMIENLAGKLPNWAALINNASIFAPDDVTNLDPDTNRKAMQVNALSPARMAQAYLSKARSDGGRRVIQITDQKLANPNPDFFSYTMSKHALDATIEMLSMGAARDDDRIYGLAPGAILASHDQTSEEAEISHRMNLLKRRTDAEEIAKAAVFLAGGALKTGQTLYVDSGQHLLRQPRDVIYLAREGHAA
ncbi:SDR family oxidoreductase [Qipengyuania gelatinilytica]|uniref:SDR family oxidoreductase n=1 Tax=Qipengyuania gelatinilytica TaxID=2867231 RepID=A0ABX9A5S6_9SPHN|nr:SDR family oxidoreductase [Qipengyuania gelatinilytica]QZD95579.1 SDR family oxidoreductase [Qipengyuania gelatinilytica]